MRLFINSIRDHSDIHCVVSPCCVMLSGFNSHFCISLMSSLLFSGLLFCSFSMLFMSLSFLVYQVSLLIPFIPSPSLLLSPLFSFRFLDRLVLLSPSPVFRFLFLLICPYWPSQSHASFGVNAMHNIPNQRLRMRKVDGHCCTL